MKNQAVLSDCLQYRYSLVRRVSDVNDKFLLFIMLNPSTADAETDDATIRKCKGFCERLGYGILNVVNLFDYRATKPENLKKAIKPCSEHNLSIIRSQAIIADKIICAWGTHGTYGQQNIRILSLLKEIGKTPFALDITKDGHPKHPLYIPYDKKPIKLERTP